jgi:hypothetical protein
VIPGQESDQWKKLNGIERWVNCVATIQSSVRLSECWKLYKLARESKKPIVEIGSWLGRSTIVLAGGSKDGNGSMIYSVDTWKDLADNNNFYKDFYPDFIENIKYAGVDDRITILKGKSVDMAKYYRENIGEEIGVLFIDADHEYESIKSDYDSWSPMVNGTIAFHDYTHCSGVKRFIDELEYPKEMVYSMAVIEKFR